MYHAVTISNCSFLLSSESSRIFRVVVVVVVFNLHNETVFLCD